MREDLQQSQSDMHLTDRSGQVSQKKFEVALPPINGEWLPRSAVYALVDLMVVHVGRPKGLFKDCIKRIQSGMTAVLGQFL